MFTFAPKRLFKRSKKIIYFALVSGACLALPSLADASEVDLRQQQNAGLYSDVFNNNIYHEFVDYLNFAILYRKVTGKKTAAANVNIYDEVADSLFYTNRHARTRLSPTELAQGTTRGREPDLSGLLSVITARAEGLNPAFFVRDKQGDVYLLKFDPPDNLELATSAEVVASRFYHALGYNVSPSSIAYVEASQFIPSEGARFYDHTGFKHQLTPEALEELLLFIPYAENGNLRVSAIKLIEGEVTGTFDSRGRNRSDPQDLIPHENRRELRALRVFSSWLNNYDVRRGNTLQTVVHEEGQSEFKYTLLNYSASFGAGFHDAKPPMFTHEHLFDYGEAFKAYIRAGFWEKPWQTRWHEANEEVGSPAVGYFDNRHFDPGKFKVQLPSRAFKNLTNADGFWAAKVIMTFTDEDVRGLVKAGRYSKQEDEETIAAVLIERRNMIGRYWFGRVSPLDGFDIEAGQAAAADRLVFTDLAVKFNFNTAAETIYRTEILGVKGNKQSRITMLEGPEPAIIIDKTWFETADSLSYVIQAVRQSEEKANSGVTVNVGPEGIQSIAH